MSSPHLLLWKGLFGLDASQVDPEPQPGGIILFARNLDEAPERGPQRCHALISELQDRWGGPAPLAVALDQEGGAVSRLRTWVGPTPSFHRIWETGGPQACRTWGWLWGQGLALLGFNVDFAPVADLYQLDTAMGQRCASGTPADTARAAGAFLEGLESTGVRGCLKHWPGLGGTALDSHVGLPELHDPQALQRNRMPFLALSHPDRLAMVAHLLIPDSQGLPASLSPKLVAQNPWGVTARWIPDDLEMGGCKDWDWDQRTRLALQAGHMALLVCQTPAGIQACAQSALQLPRELWEPAVAQFLAYRRGLAAPRPFQPEAWRGWVDSVRAQARLLE